LTEEVSNTSGVVNGKAHHVVDEFLGNVVRLVVDDEIVALKEDDDREIAAKIHVFRVACESWDIGNVGSAGIGTGSDCLEELDEEIRDIEVEDESLEFEKFGSVDESGVSRGSWTDFEIANQVEGVDNEQEIGDEGRGGNLGGLLDVEGVVKLACVETKRHEDGAEIALEISGCVVAGRGGNLGVNSHLGEERVGGGRGRSGGLRNFLFVFELEALKLGGDLEIECASRHCGRVVCKGSGEFSCEISSE
jgi:hypothetical protein